MRTAERKGGEADRRRPDLGCFPRGCWRGSSLKEVSLFIIICRNVFILYIVTRIAFEKILVGTPVTAFSTKLLSSFGSAERRHLHGGTSANMPTPVLVRGFPKMRVRHFLIDFAQSIPLKPDWEWIRSHDYAVS